MPGELVAGSKETTESVPRPDLTIVWYVPEHEAVRRPYGRGAARRTTSDGSQSDGLEDSITVLLAAVAALSAAAVRLKG